MRWGAVVGLFSFLHLDHTCTLFSATFHLNLAELLITPPVKAGECQSRLLIRTNLVNRGNQPGVIWFLPLLAGFVALYRSWDFQDFTHSLSCPHDVCQQSKYHKEQWNRASSKNLGSFYWSNYSINCAYLVLYETISPFEALTLVANSSRITN